MSFGKARWNEERLTRRVRAGATPKAHWKGYTVRREVLNAYGNHGAKFCGEGDKYVWSLGSSEERKHQRGELGRSDPAAVIRWLSAAPATK